MKAQSDAMNWRSAFACFAAAACNRSYELCETAMTGSRDPRGNCLVQKNDGIVSASATSVKVSE
jgi:hypothetical protein